MKKVLILSALLISLFQIAAAQAFKQYNLGKGNLAIEGYDPVAYFTASKAIEGKKEFSVNEGNVIYYFSAQQNRDLFKMSPAKYVPQYGGWCAYAMGSTGEKVEVDPETFKIVNGKLYLFYNKFLNNTLKSWNKDEASLKNKADASWAKFIR